MNSFNAFILMCTAETSIVLQFWLSARETAINGILSIII